MPTEGEEEARRSHQHQTRALRARGDGGQKPSLAAGVEPEHRRAQPHHAAASGQDERRRGTGLGRSEPPAPPERLLALEKDEGDASGQKDLGRGKARGPAAGDGHLRAQELRGRTGRGARVREQAQARQVAGDLGHHLVSHRNARKHGVVVEPARKEPVDGGEDVHLRRRVTVLALKPHPWPRRNTAAEKVGRPVHAHEALRAPRGEAEGAARSVVLHAPGQHGVSGHEERHRHRLAVLCRDGRSLEVDGDGAFGGDGDEAAHGERGWPLSTPEGWRRGARKRAGAAPLPPLVAPPGSVRPTGRSSATSRRPSSENEAVEDKEAEQENGHQPLSE